MILSSGTLIVLFVLIESEDKLPSVNDHWAGAIVSAESGQGVLQCVEEPGGSAAVLCSRQAIMKNSSLSGLGPHCL